MAGGILEPRPPDGGCHGCGAPRGAVGRAMVARPGAGGLFWLCTDCATVATRRRDFVDEYARRSGLPPARGGDAAARGP